MVPNFIKIDSDIYGKTFIYYDMYNKAICYTILKYIFRHTIYHKLHVICPRVVFSTYSPCRHILITHVAELISEKCNTFLV